MSRPLTDAEAAAESMLFDRGAAAFDAKAAEVNTEEEAQTFVYFWSGVARRMVNSRENANNVDQRRLPERIAGIAIEGLCRFAGRADAECWTALDWPEVRSGGG